METERFYVYGVPFNRYTTDDGHNIYFPAETRSYERGDGWSEEKTKISNMADELETAGASTTANEAPDQNGADPQQSVGTDARSLTFGEKLVGLTFNPSGDPKVQKANELCAELADLLHQDFVVTEPAPIKDMLFGHAVDDILSAQMKVVKMLTLKY